MSTGIKETLDCITAVQDFAEALTEAKKDGSIDIFDIRLLPHLIGSLREALKDSTQIPVELADLDRPELETLASAGISAITALVTCFYKIRGIYEIRTTVCARFYRWFCWRHD